MTKPKPGSTDDETDVAKPILTEKPKPITEEKGE